MSDFTESLKRTLEAHSQVIQAQAEIQRRKASFIRANAPAFWSKTEQVIRNECDEMRRDFPNDRLRNPFVDNYAGFTLNSMAMPRRILAASLDVEGQAVVTNEGVKNYLEHRPMLTPTGPISITVGPEENLEFAFYGRKCYTPEDLAHAMIKYICQL